MPDDPKPNPLEDLRQGLGLLIRAAKTTIEKIPTGELEEAVKTGAKEVGRAIENVTHAVEEQILRKPSARAPGSDAPKADAAREGDPHAPPTEETKPEDPPK